MTDNSVGLYLHIPFCERKCAYCDFYSHTPSGDVVERYSSALIKEIEKWGGKLENRPIDTIYIGGGTPSLLGEHIISIIAACQNSFNITADAEITAEVNPESAAGFLESALEAGVNRISAGAQSGSDDMLKTLGRIHTVSDTKNAVLTAKKLGFNNLSLDIMIGLPESSVSTLKNDLDFLLDMEPRHISAYILKLEPGTAMYKSGVRLPDGDAVADQYLFMCDYLEKRGFSHYEISNFAKEGYESRHNLKYWQDNEYIGIGPAAHSYLNGKRFFYPRDTEKFITAPETVDDGDGGSEQEKIMLNLRLKSGIDLNSVSPFYRKRAEKKLSMLKEAGYITVNGSAVSLTDKGMLVSNSIISELIL